jgi:Fur family ferric uptake transcriptional regulator
MNAVEQILQQHKLKKTQLRHAVLTLLIQSERGLSHQDLSQELELPFDRVTLFRTLHAFEEAGILHKIIDLNGTAKYAYTLPDDVHKEKSHAHFICLQCQEVFCLETVVPLGDIQVPKDFRPKIVDVQVKGLCPVCS